MWVGLLRPDYLNTQGGSSFERNLLTAGIRKVQTLLRLFYKLVFSNFSSCLLLICLEWDPVVLIE